MRDEYFSYQHIYHTEVKNKIIIIEFAGIFSSISIIGNKLTDFPDT